MLTNNNASRRASVGLNDMRHRTIVCAVLATTLLGSCLTGQSASEPTAVPPPKVDVGQEVVWVVKYRPDICLPAEKCEARVYEWQGTDRHWYGHLLVLPDREAITWIGPVLRQAQEGDAFLARGTVSGFTDVVASPDARPSLVPMLQNVTLRSLEDEPSCDAAGVRIAVQTDAFSQWMIRNVGRLKKYWLIPAAASAVRGTVEISFDVDKSGAITNLSIDRSLTAPADEAARRAVVGSGPWSPVPESITPSPSSVSVKFCY